MGGAAANWIFHDLRELRLSSTRSVCAARASGGGNVRAKKPFPGDFSTNVPAGKQLARPPIYPSFRSQRSTGSGPQRTLNRYSRFPDGTLLYTAPLLLLSSEKRIRQTTTAPPLFASSISLFLSAPANLLSSEAARLCLSFSPPSSGRYIKGLQRAAEHGFIFISTLGRYCAFVLAHCYVLSLFFLPFFNSFFVRQPVTFFILSGADRGRLGAVASRSEQPQTSPALLSAIFARVPLQLRAGSLSGPRRTHRRGRRFSRRERCLRCPARGR